MASMADIATMPAPIPRQSRPAVSPIAWLLGPALLLFVVFFVLPFAVMAVLSAGGTITHHHAVGRDHKRWLAEEIGPVGVEMLRAVKERIDPQGVLNPGILVP